MFPSMIIKGQVSILPIKGHRHNAFLIIEN